MSRSPIEQQRFDESMASIVAQGGVDGAPICDTCGRMYPSDSFIHAATRETVSDCSTCRMCKLVSWQEVD